MNNLLLCFLFLFGFSLCTNAQSFATYSKGKATLMKPAASLQKTKAQITEDLQVKVASLSQALQSGQLDELTLKMRTAEVLLFKVLLSDINNGRQVREAYEVNFQQFWNDFSVSTPYWHSQKVSIANEVNRIVYLN